MTIRVDPEGSETSALFGLDDFFGKRVLEIGSGDGRLTWLYADRASRITAIEPFAPSVEKAIRELPAKWRERIEFQHASIDEFEAKPESFDIALLSWALC